MAETDTAEELRKRGERPVVFERADTEERVRTLSRVLALPTPELS